MPEYSQASLVLAYGVHGIQRVIDAQKLVIFGDQFDQRAARVAKQREVLHDIQQAALLRGSANHGFERDDAFFLLVTDLLPLEEVFPASRDTADPALAAVREDNEGIVPEDLWNGILVVAQVIAIGIFESLVRCLQFDEYQWKTVDEAHQVRPPFVHLARNPELRDEQEVVVRGIVPVDDTHRLVDLFVPVATNTDVDPVFQQSVYLAVSVGKTESAAITRQFLNGNFNGFPR